MSDVEMVLEIDGASKGNPGPAGAGYILSQGGSIMAQGKVGLGITTNNVAEYSALILGLQKALEMGASRVLALTDSILLARQMTGSYRVRQDHLKPLHARCVDLVSRLASFRIRHIPSNHNRAHALAEEAAREMDHI